jgi:ABC-2 type transport system ATP-binding protein
MIAVEHLTKRYGVLRAVDDLSFMVPAGTVVGFLGRNGAGKSSTLRVLAGLARPTEGRATIDGTTYNRHRDPLRVAGFGLDANAFHPAISGRRALCTIALRGGVPRSRVTAALELVELDVAADRPVGKYSMGMRQRLLLAAAMLGDPRALILDEPTNGLDPQGHRWLRDFLRARAKEGRAVLLSSHVLGDVSETVDRVVVISLGRLVADTPIAELTGGGAGVRVRSPQCDRLNEVLSRSDASVDRIDHQTLRVAGVRREQVGEIAAAAGLVLHELVTEQSSLEDAFFELTEAEGMALR